MTASVLAVLLSAVTLTVLPGALPVAAETASSAAAGTGSESVSTAADASAVPTNGISGWPKAQDIISTAGCLMDADTGAVLFDKSMDTEMYPASVTKIMTCLLALEKGNLSDQVTMTQTGVAYVRSDSSNLNTKVGEVFTLEQLLYGTMLKSANDMATQAGEYIGGGSLDNFIQMMNDKAKELGCTGTHFSNACGMPDTTHVTTAHDLALISREALKIEEFRTIVGTHSYTIPATNMTSSPREFTSHDPLLVSPDYYYPGIIGGKTGNTNDAQSTLAVFAERNGMTLIAIALHASDGSYVAKDCISLLDYGFSNFQDISVGNEKYIYSGGKITLPAAAFLKDCKITEEKAADTDQGKMVNEIYTYSGQQVGNLMMTAENAEKYSKELKEEAESQAKQQDLASSDNSADGSGNASDASAAETTSAEDSASVSQEETSHLPSAAFYIIAVFSVLVFVGFLLILITLVRRNKKSGRE